MPSSGLKWSKFNWNLMGVCESTGSRSDLWLFWGSLEMSETLHRCCRVLYQSDLWERANQRGKRKKKPLQKYVNVNLELFPTQYWATFAPPWSLVPALLMSDNTSRLKDRTTSDLDSVFSSSWPMSMIEVLCPRFSFWILNSPPLDTGMLSRLAISWLTEDLSSSIYMASMSLDTNLGNLPACLEQKRLAITYLQSWWEFTVISLHCLICSHGWKFCTDVYQQWVTPCLWSTFQISVWLTLAIWSAIWRRPSSSLLIWAACSSRLSSCGEIKEVD